VTQRPDGGGRAISVSASDRNTAYNDRLDQERFRERRRARLRAEMLDAGLGLRLDGPAGEALLREIDYARFPPVHEREFPTYGAILLGGPAAMSDQLDAVVYRVASEAQDLARLMADGRQSFILRARGRTELMVLPTPHDHEDELVRLRRQLGPTRFNAVQRTPGGAVRVFGRSGLAVWDGAHWWEKPYATTYARAVLRAIPDASDSALDAILDFCVHSVSPSPTGAILVWALDDEVIARLSAAPTTRLPALSLQDRITHGPVRHLLSQIDGAAVLSPTAELVNVRVHLPASAEAHDSISVDPQRGTRHGSARRFSFDERRAVLFVVSEDGPVTVYFKGMVVASIRSRLEQEAPGRAAASSGGGVEPVGSSWT
jgi:hypothetical protein